MMKILLTISALFILTACDNTARFLDCIDGCSTTRGEQGLPGPQGPTGPQGPQGVPGLDGADGASGLSCTVNTLPTGAIINCEDGTTSTIVNGVDGNDGTTIEQIELCPNVSGGAFHEYLLKIDGNLYGVYASGQKIGMTKLSAGTWVTTDGRNCTFVVHSDGSISY